MCSHTATIANTNAWWTKLKCCDVDDDHCTRVSSISFGFSAAVFCLCLCSLVCLASTKTYLNEKCETQTLKYFSIVK